MRISQLANVSRPSTTPLSSSVMAHATVKEVGSFGLRAKNEGLWPSYNCLDTHIPTELCPDPLLGQAHKTFGFADWVPSFTFAVQGGAQCRTVGLDVNDMKREMKRVFLENEGKGVEKALRDIRFDPAGLTGVWEAPVDLTTTGMPLVAALAALEGYAAAVYSGTPTIHMPRAAAVLLGERIVWVGGKAYTRSGAKVALGGGYDSDVDGPLDPLMDLYATGEVYIETSEMEEAQVFTLPGEGTSGSDAVDALVDNNVLTLVERMYRVAVDCFVAKATGKAW